MIIISIAWRNIWRNKVRSLLIMLSVAVGLFSGMMALALYKGMMAGRVKTVIAYETGNIQIHHPSFKDDYDPALTLTNSDSLVEVIKNLPALVAMTYRSITQGMLSTTTGSAGVQITGVHPANERAVSGLDLRIIAGKYFSEDRSDGVLIGKKLADKMKLRTGNKLVLTFTDVDSEIISAAFRVMAVYQSENTPMDERIVYVQAEKLNELLGIEAASHELVILLNGDRWTNVVRDQLKQKFPDQLVENWRDLSPETELMVDAVDVYSYIIIVIILFALAFGIINTMLMAVLERTREIGMMMALGLTRFKLFSMIIMETVFLTLVGAPFGLWNSWLYTNYLNKNGIDWSQKGQEMMSSFGFSQIIYPEFPAEKLMPVLVIVSATAIVSCLMPAARALRLKPTDALRK